MAVELRPNFIFMRSPELRRPRLVVLLLLASLAASCNSPPPRAVAPPRREKPDSTEPSDLIGQVVEAHNARRAEAGLPPLVESPRLEQAAEVQARDMAGRRKMSHRGADGSSPFDRMKRQGYSFRTAAENVAYGFDDVESVMRGWMKSAGHKRNILGNFSEIGVSRATATDGASYWCVTFGTPLDSDNPLPGRTRGVSFR